MAASTPSSRKSKTHKAAVSVFETRSFFVFKEVAVGSSHSSHISGGKSKTLKRMESNIFPGSSWLINSLTFGRFKYITRFVAPLPIPSVYGVVTYISYLHE